MDGQISLLSMYKYDEETHTQNTKGEANRV